MLRVLTSGVSSLSSQFPPSLDYYSRVVDSREKSVNSNFRRWQSWPLSTQRWLEQKYSTNIIRCYCVCFAKTEVYCSMYVVPFPWICWMYRFLFLSQQRQIIAGEKPASSSLMWWADSSTAVCFNFPVIWATIGLVMTLEFRQSNITAAFPSTDFTPENTYAEFNQSDGNQEKKTDTVFKEDFLEWIPPDQRRISRSN